MCCSLFAGCRYFRSSADRPDTSGYDKEQVEFNLLPLNFSAPYPPPAAIADYFHFYGLDSSNAQHFFGTVESGGNTLAAHVFLPSEPRATLFLLHGYFDHTGTLSKLIAEGLSRRYAIVVWDLPGHGLSTGDRTETGGFNRCAEQFIDILERSENHLPRPYHLVAHSTGCSIAMEYMYNAKPNAFERIVFLAPLIHHAHWGWAKFGYTIAKPFTKTIRRRDKQNSSDNAYIAFVKKDPLHSSELSFEYLEDLYTWNKRVQTYPVWPGSLLIIQGDADDIVDWNYNLAFLRKKIQHTDVVIIPGARHQLANESDELRTQAFEHIFDYLKTQITPKDSSPYSSDRKCARAFSGKL
jgi:alpha-beta hydrolase superfamily lysophospholipase